MNSICRVGEQVLEHMDNVDAHLKQNREKKEKDLELKVEVCVYVCICTYRFVKYVEK